MTIKAKDKDLADPFADISAEGENRVLKATINYLKQELRKFRKKALIVCEVSKIYNDKVMIKLPNGSSFLVNVLGEVIKDLKPGDLVLAEQRSLVIIDKLEKAKKFEVESFVILDKPGISWSSIGGLKDQIREIKEVIELPLKKPELFKEVGIKPPKGILLYGPPGTGKTLLAKAVATSTNATFIEMVGSELNQKFIGEGARLVKDLFQLARERAPSVIFIDEIDALAAERVDIGTSGEREVQRTFMQFLAELDGFKHLDNVKVIGATNRIDILDQALLRPGRFDRLIELPLPMDKERTHIFKIHSKEMNLDEIDFKELSKLTEELSGAEIQSICTEAGYFAIRNKRKKVNFNDFLMAVQKVKVDSDNAPVDMFG